MVIKSKQYFVGGKKAWIRIVEAFVAILLIMGVLLVLINRGYIGDNISSKVYEAELSILRGIQLDDELRNNILISNRSDYDPSSGESPLPIEWGAFEDVPGERRLKDVKNKILNQIPNYLDCKAKICELDSACVLSEVTDKEIYAQPATIVANYAVFSPRQLKLFCWVK